LSILGCGIIGIRQAVEHTVEPLVPEPTSYAVDIAIEELKRYKSPGSDGTTAELIETTGIT
jgi:hypothetical protein